MALWSSRGTHVEGCIRMYELVHRMKGMVSGRKADLGIGSHV